MARAMTVEGLLEENRRHAGRGGVSEHIRPHGFAPAFFDTHTGIVHLARNPDGSPAGCHRLDGLPEELILGRDADGAVTAVRPGVVAGFEHGGCFYTREQAARAVWPG